MSNAKDLKKFEHKHGTVVLSTVGSQFVITTAQRVRMDLVLATTSVLRIQFCPIWGIFILISPESILRIHQ